MNERDKDGLTQCIVSMVLSGLIMLSAELYSQNIKLQTQIKPQSHYENIDRDTLQDLVVGEKIFLADQTQEGVRYHQLSNSDRYRIQ